MPTKRTEPSTSLPRRPQQHLHLDTDKKEDHQNMLCQEAHPGISPSCQKLPSCQSRGVSPKVVKMIQTKRLVPLPFLNCSQPVTPRDGSVTSLGRRTKVTSNTGGKSGINCRSRHYQRDVSRARKATITNLLTQAYPTTAADLLPALVKIGQVPGQVPHDPASRVQALSRAVPHKGRGTMLPLVLWTAKANGGRKTTNGSSWMLPKPRP